MYGGGADGYGGYEGGASQFAGGGFMTSPGGAAGVENGGTAFSPNSGARRSGGAAPEGIVPVTIRQIGMSEMAEDSLIIDGQPAANVTVVGRVLSKAIQATNAEFLVDDGTGSINVSQWIDTDVAEERDQLSAIQPNTYVRVYARCRSFAGKMKLQSFAIRPIVDFDEITHHNLNCIFVHLCNVKAQGGVIPAATSSYPANSPAYRGPQPTSAQGQTPAAPSNQYANQYAAPPAAANGGSLKDLNGMIQAIYEDPATMGLEAGLSWHDVVQRVPGYSRAQIKEAIDFLVNEGHLYSTIDDEHFKSTSA